MMKTLRKIFNKYFLIFFSEHGTMIEAVGQYKIGRKKDYLPAVKKLTMVRHNVCFP